MLASCSRDQKRTAIELNLSFCFCFCEHTWFLCRVSGEGLVGMSFLSDNHFAQIEGIKEESILLLRNFYKVSKQNNPHQVSHNMCVLTLEKLKNYTICTQITSTQISCAVTLSAINNRTDTFKFQSGIKRLNGWDRSLIS